MGVLLVRRARDVDTSSKDSLYSFYMFLWKLFYAEYAVLPFLR
jgi:homogentisate phytyltransferase/homogentisate geranylgeranyltransferase